MRRPLTASRFAVAALAAGWLAAAAPAARATVVLALPLPALVAQADRVVLAEVTAVRAAWDARHERIDSTVELRVAETWKGAPAARQRVWQPGGTVGDTTMVVIGMPRFTPGEQAVLFLRGPVDGAAVVGLAQGKRTLRRDADGRWIAGAGAAGADTVAPDAAGRLAPAAPEAALPLDELRRRVLGLVRP